MSLVTPFRFLTAVAVLGLCVGSALGQQQQQRGRGAPGGFGGGGFGSPAQMKLTYLANEAVQKELELTNDQKADVKKLSDETQAKGREMYAGLFQGGNQQNLSEEERNKRRDEMRAKTEAFGKEVAKKMEAVLLPPQTDRLQEVYIQIRGASTLTDADIAKALALSDQQKDQLSEIRQSGFQRGQGGQQGGFDAAQFAARQKERDEKSLAVLSADQKSKFEKMKGEPFAAAAEVRQAGFGGGRPQGQGGQGNRPQGGQQRTRPGGNNNNNNT